MPSTPPIVRRATPRDLDVLVHFAQAMAAETEDKSLDPETVSAGVRAALLDADRGAYFVATREDATRGTGNDSGYDSSDDSVVGALMTTREWSDWRNGFFWWIQSVYVRPESREQGTYRALYEHVRQQARAADDVCGLRLYVERENAAARAAYEALGMRATSYRMYETSVRE